MDDDDTRDYFTAPPANMLPGDVDTSVSALLEAITAAGTASDDHPTRDGSDNDDGTAR